MRKVLLLVLLAAVPLLHGCPALLVTGVGTGVILGEDRRTTATVLEDQSIELKAESRISERFKDQVHINVTSYNRLALITGETPSQVVKAEVERIVRAVENVRGVTSELAIGPLATISSRTNDSFITSKVKARFVDAQKFQPLHVKVVTENGAVHLLGLVKRQEADDAVEIARTTSGVQKVVKVFEYLD